MAHIRYLNNEKTNRIFICRILDFINYKAHCRNIGWGYCLIASHFFVTSINLLQTDSRISCSWKRHSSLRHYQPQLMIICWRCAESQQKGRLHEQLSHLLFRYLCHWVQQTAAEWQNVKLTLQFLQWISGYRRWFSTELCSPFKKYLQDIM